MKNNLTENKYDHPIVSDWLLGHVNPVQGEGKLWVLHIPTWENGGLLGAETTGISGGFSTSGLGGFYIFSGN